MKAPYFVTASAVFGFCATAAIGQDMDVSESISQDQREALAQEVGECVGNRVYGAIQGVYYYWDGDDREVLNQRRFETELRTKLNSLHSCFADASGYNRLPLYESAPAWPEAVVEIPEAVFTGTQQQQAEFIENFLGEWADLMERHMDFETFQDAYDDATLVIPLLSPRHP